jgi:hypothetical protein
MRQAGPGQVRNNLILERVAACTDLAAAPLNFFSTDEYDSSSALVNGS